MIATVFASLWGRVLTGLLAVALVFGGIQTWRANHWKHVATVLRLDLDRIKDAQQLAAERAKAAKLETEARYRKLAEEADREHKEELDRLRSRSDAYARANSLRAKAAQSAGGSTAPAADNHGAGVPAETRLDAVVVDRADFDILVENTLRLKSAVEWANTLCSQQESC